MPFDDNITKHLCLHKFCLSYRSTRQVSRRAFARIDFSSRTESHFSIMNSKASEIPNCPPSFWSLISSDLRPDKERWQFAARIAIGGMLIIAIQMTLRFEILYPGMSILLIVSELRGAGSVTRFVLNLFAATFGCAAAVALGALFIQQPWFLLFILWLYIVAIMYFMGSTRYRGTIFIMGYPFIVINFMTFFDKENAEHIAIMVYKSVLVGICVVALLTIFLWPSHPSITLRERIVKSLGRSHNLLRSLIDHMQNKEPFDVANRFPDYYRADIIENLQLLDQAETDSGFDEREHPDLKTFLAFERQLSMGIYLAAQRFASNKFEATPDAIELLTALDVFLSRLTEKIEHLSHFAGLDEALVRLQEAARKQNDHPSFRSISNLAFDAPLAVATLRTFTILVHRPDFASVLLGNIRRCLPNLFRQRILIPNIQALKHSAKCATSILICALVCITLNWDKGIGCVETVMLVVQATFGGTLMIGSLRMLGVMIGYSLAVFTIIFLIPVVTTLTGFLLIFAPVLFCAGYGMHGSQRVSVPALQIMIVFDFSLLQVLGPDISLYPTMNFSLAVTMGVFVSFCVYRFLWRARAVDGLQGSLAEMLQSVASVMRVRLKGVVTRKEILLAEIKIEDEFARFMKLQSDAQFESYCPTAGINTRLRAAVLTHQLCTEFLLLLDSKTAEAQTLTSNLPIATAYVENLDRCCRILRCQPDTDFVPLPAAGDVPTPWTLFLQRGNSQIPALRSVINEMIAISISDSALGQSNHNQPRVGSAC